MKCDTHPLILAALGTMLTAGSALAQGAPVAFGQNLATSVNTSKTITLSATSAAGGSLTYQVVRLPAHGTLTGTPPEVIYQPEPAYNGRDSMVFTANDGSADSNPAVVKLLVNDAPAGTVRINAGKDTELVTRRTSVLLTLSVADNGPGPILMCISNEEACSTWVPFTEKKKWRLASGNGIKTVSVRFQDKWRQKSSPVSDTILLDTKAPTGGQVEVVPGDAKLTLNWGEFDDGGGSGIAGYRVVFKGGRSAPLSCNDGTPVLGFDGTAKALEHTVLADGTPLVNGKDYAYRVCAIDAAGNLSSGVTATGKPMPDTIPPDTTPPTDGTARATAGVAQQLTLSWSDFFDADSGIARYVVVFQTGSAPSSCTLGTPVPGYAGTATTLVHTGLIDGTTYGYRVCAIDVAGNTSPGATASGRPMLINFNCVECHNGNPLYPLAPNVMTYWDGSWWDSNKGGSNSKQQGGHGDPDHFPARQCVDCHDITLPPGTHLDGIYNSIWGDGSGTRNQNTAHLKASFIGGATPAWSVQLTLDAACWGCHSTIGGIMDMRHERDGTPAPGVVMFGPDSHLARNDGDALPFPSPNDQSWSGPYPVDQDISTNAGGSRYYAPCISCHDPHGTGAPAKESGPSNSNFMLRDNWNRPSILCKVCHP